MADAPALEAGGGNPVEVQVLSPAPEQMMSHAPRAWGFNADSAGRNI